MSLYKRGSVWWAGYTEYAESGQPGRRVNRSLRTRNKREAKRLHDALLAEQRMRQLGLLGAAGSESSSGPETSEALDRWSEDLAETSQPQRVRRLVKYVEQMLVFCGDYRAIEPGHVHEAQRSLRGRLGDRAIQARVQALKQFIRYCVARGWLARDSLAGLRVPSVQKRSPRRSLSRQECRALLATHTTSSRRGLLYRVALLTGLRRGELAALGPEHLREWGLDVPAALTKNRRSAQMPLPPELVLRLRGLQPHEDGRWWHLPRNAAARLRADMRRAGLSAENVCFHSLRHTFCTHAAMSADLATLQSLARHADARTTYGVYVHREREAAESVVREMGKRLGAVA